MATKPNATSKQDDVTSKQDDTTSKQDDTSKQDGTTSKQDDVTSKQDDTTSKQDDTTSKQDNIASKQDDVTSKQDDVTNRQDGATSKHNDTTNKQDDKIEVIVETSAIATQPDEHGDEEKGEHKVTEKQQVQAEEGTEATQQYVTSKQEYERLEEAAIRVDNRICSEVATPPVMSPQSVTSQESSVIFEERAL